MDIPDVVAELADAIYEYTDRSSGTLNAPAQKIAHEPHEMIFESPEGEKFKISVEKL